MARSEPGVFLRVSLKNGHICGYITKAITQKDTEESKRLSQTVKKNSTRFKKKRGWTCSTEHKLNLLKFRIALAGEKKDNTLRGFLNELINNVAIPLCKKYSLISFFVSMWFNPALCLVMMI